MPFAGTLLRHPRRLWLRRALFQIHLWAGVLLSLYVVVIALTGSLLVFRSELTRSQLPKTFRPYDPTHTPSIQQILGNFQDRYPTAKLGNLQMPSSQMPAFVLTASDPKHHSFTLVADPATAALALQPRSWVDWVYDLHVYLLLGHSYGMQVNGIGAAGLLLLTVTGLLLWWPGIKLWTRGLRIGFGHNWRRINFDAHHAIGFWTLAIVFWWSVSGVYFGWYRQVTAAVSMLSPIRGMRPPTPPHVVSGQTHATLHQVLTSIHQASPSGTLFSLSDPALAGTSVYALVDLRAPGDFSHRDILTLSTADARVLTVWRYGQNRTLGDWFLWAMHPLHFGSLWGMGIKILWAALGVSLAVLTVTGLLMYWNRYLRHQFSALGTRTVNRGAAVPQNTKSAPSP